MRVDTGELIEMGAALRVVADEFEHANENSDAVAEAAGGGDLGAAIRDFAHEWDDKRRKMTDDIAGLAESATVTVTGETFARLDREFAAALRGER